MFRAPGLLFKSCRSAFYFYLSFCFHFFLYMKKPKHLILNYGWCSLLLFFSVVPCSHLCSHLFASSGPLFQRPKPVFKLFGPTTQVGGRQILCSQHAVVPKPHINRPKRRSGQVSLIFTAFSLPIQALFRPESDLGGLPRQQAQVRMPLPWISVTLFTHGINGDSIKWKSWL